MAKRGSLAPALALGIALVAPISARASKVLVDDPVSVWVDDEAGPGVTSGFTPLSFHLQNHGSVPASVVIELTGALAHLTRTVHLDAKERRDAILAVPWSSNGGTVVATVNGHRSPPEAVYWSQGRRPVVLAVGPASEVLAAVPGPWSTSEKSAPGEPSTHPETRIIQSDALPDSLGGLVGFRAVLVFQPEWGELSRAQRQVLEDYLATGGTLVVRGAPESLAPSLPGWEASHESSGDYGFGRLRTCDTPEACATALAEIEGGTESSSLVPDRWSPDHRQQFGEYGMLSEPLEPLLAVAKAPVGSFLVIVLLFAGALGFGSFALRRRYGPQVLVAFIPLTALSTCSGITTYGSLHEGLFTVHTTAKVLTLLDSERHREATLALGGYYAGLAPSEVRFSNRAAPLLLAPDQINQRFTIDETEGLSMREGYLSSRTYQEHFVAEVRPTRARLALEQEGANLHVENALGAKVRRGRVRFHGDAYELGAIADGASGIATPVAESRPQLDATTADLSRFAREALDHLANAPLEEGEFEVTLDEAPFMPEAALHAVPHDEFQYVRGRVSP